MSPQVVHVDILDRHIDKSTGILYTERLIACTQPMPVWMRRLLGTEDVSYFREISFVNPREMTHEAVTKNLTFSNLMTVEERIQYSPSSADSENTTDITQEAAVDASAGYSLLKNNIEDYSLGRFEVNAEKGRKGLDDVIRKLRAETSSV